MTPKKTYYPNVASINFDDEKVTIEKGSLTVTFGEKDGHIHCPPKGTISTSIGETTTIEFCPLSPIAPKEPSNISFEDSGQSIIIRKCYPEPTFHNVWFGGGYDISDTEKQS